MKGGSREAKGHKSMGDGRTWYGKRETLTPLSPPPPPLSVDTCETLNKYITIIDLNGLI